MVVTTHKEFKSLVSNVKDAEVLHNYVGHDLKYQYYFKKYMPKSERENWPDEKLSNLKIDVENIIRLYHLSHQKTTEFEKRRLACAMIYQNSTLYILMTTSYKDGSRSDKIVFTFTPRLFVRYLSMNNEKHHRFDMEAVVNSLEKDRAELPEDLKRLFNTYKEFKSLVDDVQDTETINNCVGHILEHQDQFETYTTPLDGEILAEKSEFKIEIENIVRLYHLLHEKTAESETYELACAIIYDNSIVYVSMTVIVYHAGDKKDHKEIFFTFNPRAFMNNLLTGDKKNRYDIASIISSLAEDDVKLFGYLEKHSLNNYPEFKSLVSHVRNAKEINTLLGGVLEHQDKIRKYTTVMDGKEMLRDEISTFKIDVEKIVRLYHLFYAKDADSETYELVCAMVYDDNSIVYVLMTGDKSANKIFFTFNPHRLLEFGTRDQYDINSMASALLEEEDIKLFEYRLNNYQDFKSLVSHVRDAKEINTLLGGVLERQDNIEKYTTVTDGEEVLRNEISTFKIEVEKMVRLYHLFHEKNDESETYDLACTMVYRDSIVYVVMTIFRDFNYEKSRDEEIFFTFCPYTFMNRLLMKSKQQQRLDADVIINSLKDDGIDLLA